MCVTNTTYRRTMGAPPGFGVNPSDLSQHLLGAYVAKVPQQAAPPAPESMPAVETSALQQGKALRPKRRRKPQKPGKTAKLNDRHFVVHNYHDHSADSDAHDGFEEENANERRRGGVSVAFPVKLHAVLDQVEADGLSHVISWQQHGRCFVIHDPKEFVDHVMPRLFRQTKLTSFQRQLNLYGFCRLTRGPDAGGYYHELFLRNKVFLCKQMIRTKVKGTRFKAASSPDHEPNFYSMPPVTVSPNGSSDEEQSANSHDVNEAVSYFAVQQPVASANYLASVPYPEISNIQPIARMAPSQAYPVSEADRVLDEAVNELFLYDDLEDDNLSSFVNDWNPNSGAGGALTDDAHLGFMLERILAD